MLRIVRRILSLFAAVFVVSHVITPHLFRVLLYITFRCRNNGRQPLRKIISKAIYLKMFPKIHTIAASVQAFSTQVRGFKPGRSRRIFKGEKILSTPSFGGEVKPSVPCRRFAACKRSLLV